MNAVTARGLKAALIGAARRGEARAFLAALPAELAEALSKDWEVWGAPEQLPPGGTGRRGRPRRAPVRARRGRVGVGLRRRLALGRRRFSPRPSGTSPSWRILRRRPPTCAWRRCRHPRRVPRGGSGRQLQPSRAGLEWGNARCGAGLLRRRSERSEGPQFDAAGATRSRSDRRPRRRWTCFSSALGGSASGRARVATTYAAGRCPSCARLMADLRDGDDAHGDRRERPRNSRRGFP